MVWCGLLWCGVCSKVTLEKEEKPGGVLKPAKAAKAWKTILAVDA